MKKLVLAASLALAAAVPATAQDLTRDALGGGFASDSQVIPVMVNNPGLQGATFQSWVALMNPTASRFTVTATFYDTAGTATTRTIDLAAGELKTYPNFVQTVFNVTGAGAVKLTAPESAGGSHNNRFIVSTEVYTATGGRFGTMVPAQEFAATASRSFAAGIGVNATTRSNVGCFDQSGEANTITPGCSTPWRAVSVVTLTSRPMPGPGRDHASAQRLRPLRAHGAAPATRWRSTTERTPAASSRPSSTRPNLRPYGSVSAASGRR
jgi:hypothetical protein